MARLHASRPNGTFRKVYHKLLRVDVLVLDDFELVPLSTRGAEDLNEIIRARYEQKPVIVTSNRLKGEWAEVFGNQLMASAALDRLTHYAYFIEMKGDSYR